MRNWQILILGSIAVYLITALYAFLAAVWPDVRLVTVICTAVFFCIATFFMASAFSELKKP